MKESLGMHMALSLTSIMYAVSSFDGTLIPGIMALQSEIFHWRIMELRN